MKKLYSLLLVALLSAATAMAGTAVFNFTTDALTLFGFSAPSDGNGSTSGDILEAKTVTVDGIELTVSPANEGAQNPNRVWQSSGGYELRVYSGTVSLKAPAGVNITAIATETGSKTNAPTPSVGTWDGKNWSGSANELTLTFAAQYQFKVITVTTDGEGGGTPDPDPDPDPDPEPDPDPDPSGSGTALFDFHNNGLTMFPGITAASTSDSGAGDITEAKSVTISGVTLTVNPADGNTPVRFWNDYNAGLQLRMYGTSTIVLTAPTGSNLTSITFTSGTQFNAPTVSSGKLAEGVWTGSANSVTFTFAKRADLVSIEAAYGEGGGEGGGDADRVSIADFEQLKALADDAKFTFDAESYVLYQSGKYLYARALFEEDGSTYASDMLLFGDAGVEYTPGDIIPAGWKGTKTTYKGTIEAKDLSDLAAATSQTEEDNVLPFNNDDYFGEWYDEYDMDMYYQFTGVTYDVPAEGSKNFTIYGKDGEGNDATIDGYNQFGIEIAEPEEGLVYTITGFACKYNDNWQFYPVSIEVGGDAPAAGTPMWEIWYEGVDGEQYTVQDDLIVGFVSEPEKLIYVTDNATEVVVEGSTYEWAPDWAAIDCGTDEALFNQIAAMKMIKGGTLNITLQDNYTNPRFVVAEAPEALEGEVPEIQYSRHYMSKELNMNGNEVAHIQGYFVENEGKTYLADATAFADATKYIEVDRNYMDQSEVTFNEGTEYYMRTIVKQNEEWESSDDEEAAPALAAKKLSAKKGLLSKKSQMAKPARRHKVLRRITTDDPLYFTNYSLIPVDEFQDAADVPVEVEGVQSFADIYAMEDGEEFTYGNEAYVLYQNGNYLYVRSYYEMDFFGMFTIPMNSDGLIFGKIDQTYEPGDIIPAGWTGARGTYKGTIEAVNVQGLQPAAGKCDPADIEPVNNDSYFGDWYDEYDMNAYYEFTDVTYDAPDASGNFNIYKTIVDDDGIESEANIAGFNKFKIDIAAPEADKPYRIEGFCAVFNDNWQFYPIAIEEYKGEEKLMWEIWYEGENGSQYLVKDDLIVGFVSDEEKLIYVTDNASEITYEGEQYEWAPDWAAIDCGDDEALFNQIAAMKMIKGGTLQLTLEDNYTNPRFVVSIAPEALEGEAPEIAYEQNVIEEVFSYGNTIYMMEGYLVNDEAGATYLADAPAKADATIYVAVDRMYIDKVNLALQYGSRYSMRAIGKIAEAWESSDSEGEEEYAAPLLAKGVSAKDCKLAKAPRAHKVRRIATDDPEYFTNITIIPIDNFQLVSGADDKFDVNGDGSVDVGDVNAVLEVILEGGLDLDFDVNGDGKVDVGDVNAILEVILKQ